MKTKLTLLLVVLLPFAAHAADDLSTALQKGLFEEEANQNLPAAIKAYESLLAASDEQRKLAATALFRLGECYRKLGRTNDAVTQYQRLIRDYADQNPLATLSRQNLAGLGSKPVPTAGNSMTTGVVATAEAEELARTERILAQLSGRDLSQVRRLLPTMVPDADFERYERLLVEAQEKILTSSSDQQNSWRAREVEYLGMLTRRFDQIKASLSERAERLRFEVARQSSIGIGRPSANDGSMNPAAPTDEEGKEIRRIQALIKNSPDLINAVNVEIERVRSGELMVPKNGTLLHKAANLGQLTVAKFLLEQGADVGARDELGRTPLHRAAGNGHKAMVELLLANKADANAKVSHSSDTGSTSLNLAMKKGYRSVCEALLERGADPNLGDGSGGSPIYSAVFARDEASLRLLIAKGARVNPYLEMKSDTPLHNATTPAIAKILIEAGAPVDALNGANKSPLHAKAREGNLGVLEILLAAGANPSLKDSVGQTPLHLAAVGWNANVITRLITKGANPNERDSADGTPLDALIRSGYARNTDFARQIEALRALLAGGADPNLIQRGSSPHLYRAVAEGLEEQAEMLLKAGADPNSKYVYSDGNGWQTSLIVALQGTKHPERAGQKTRSMDLVKLLLDYKADPNLSNGAGTSPLWFAMAHGSRDFAERAPFVEVLLQRGANIEGRDSDGKTLLAVAVELGMKEMTEMLLKRKADPNAKIGNGKSPLHLAASSRNMELVDILLAAGADPNALDSQGLSALDYVKQSRSSPLPPGARMIAPRSGTLPDFPSPQSSQPKDTAQSELADRLRKAGARDWAPRPGLITVTRRSTGASQVIFTKGTNDLNRYSLLELMSNTYLGSGTSFPFPDLSKITITRADATVPGGIKEFTVDLIAALAKDGCRADHPLEWGDLIDIPEGEHKLDERWLRLGIEEAGMINKCLARTVTIIVKGKVNEVPLTPGSWVAEPVNGQMVYGPERPYRLRRTVLNSGLLLTSSDIARVNVTRPDTTGGPKVWTFDLTKEPSAGDDLWLRDGDVIEVPER